MVVAAVAKANTRDNKIESSRFSNHVFSVNINLIIIPAAIMVITKKTIQKITNNKYNSHFQNFEQDHDNFYDTDDNKH